MKCKNTSAHSLWSKTWLSFLGVMLSASSWAMTVQLFTDTHHPIALSGVSQLVTVHYYNLDELPILVNQMNEALAGEDGEEATRQAKILLKQDQKPIQHAAEGVRYFHQYALTAIPAIVFDDGRYVVVGQNNLSTAVQEYQQWQSSQP